MLTTLPAGIVFDDVKSLLRNRTVPVAFSFTTRLPVAGNVPLVVTSTDTVSAGTTGGSANASGVVTDGSAAIVISTGPTDSSFGVTTIEAEGSQMYAPTPPTRSTSATMARPIASAVRPPRPLVAGRGRARAGRVTTAEDPRDVGPAEGEVDEARVGGLVVTAGSDTSDPEAVGPAAVGTAAVGPEAARPAAATPAVVDATKAGASTSSCGPGSGSVFGTAVVRALPRDGRGGTSDSSAAGAGAG